MSGTEVEGGPAQLPAKRSEAILTSPFKLASFPHKGCVQVLFEGMITPAGCAGDEQEKEYSKQRG